MDVVGIGLANIDLVAHVGDALLFKYNLIKGQATKIADLNFGRLRAELESFDAVAGGCAANTICGLANAGFETRFYGKTGNDAFDSVFRGGFRPYGVAYDVKPATRESSQCAVLITPDGERTFAYCSGASWDLVAEDLDLAELGDTALVYAEIYAMAFGQKGNSLWPHLINHLRATGVPLAIKVMDREYAALYRGALFALAEEGILNLIVGNADNLPALAGKTELDEAIEEFKKRACMVLLTRGSKGADFINGGTYLRHTPSIIENVLNTSGAGDQFAAGFLEGFLTGLEIHDCLNLAERRAVEILMYDSPRPPLTLGRIENMRF
jgi:sugar/nucleoside kinase (ribokinase family)